MREYELIYVIQPDASDERVGEIHARIDGVIGGGQGLVLLRDDWGKRKLAYEINKFQKGQYFQLNFLGDGKFIVEMERLLRIDPDLLRFLTVLVDEEVADVEARVELAKEQAAEQEKRRAERERIEAEREAERAEAAARAVTERANDEAAAREAAESSDDQAAAVEGAGDDAPVAEAASAEGDPPADPPADQPEKTPEKEE